MITKEEVMEILNYDEFTGIFTWKVRKGTARIGDEAGCVSVSHKGKAYRLIRINWRLYLAHRIAWLLLTGKFPEDQIDHIDGNGLNNKFENLRAVSNTENARNARRPKNNTSGVMGAYWRKDRAAWVAEIRVDRKNIYLGQFKSLDQAAAVRKEAEIKYGFHENHGEDRPL